MIQTPLHPTLHDSNRNGFSPKPRLGGHRPGIASISLAFGWGDRFQLRPPEAMGERGPSGPRPIVI